MKGVEYDEQPDYDGMPLDKRVIEYCKPIVDLQYLLMNLTKDNLNEYAEAISNSVFVSSLSYIRNLCIHFLEAADYRPLKIDLYCELIKEITAKKTTDKNQNLASLHLPTEILRACFLSVSNPLPYPNESSRPFFCYHCYLHQIFSLNEFTEFLKGFFTMYDYPVPKMWMLGYFLPELIDNENFISFAKGKAIDEKGFGIFKEASIKGYIDTNFEEYKKIRDRNDDNFNHHDIRWIIRNDDIELLCEYLSPDFNLNQRVKSSPFEECWFVNRSPSLISYAAYFGAVKCFKYLFLNKADLQSYDDNRRTLPQFAVAGGNLEIVRLVEQTNCDFDMCSEWAIHFFHTHIYQWIHETKAVSESFSKSEFISAAFVQNIRFLLELIKAANGNVNHMSDSGQSALLKASENGKSDSVRVLLSVHDISFQCDYGGETPIIYAARNGRDEVCNLLVLHPSLQNNDIQDGLKIAKCFKQTKCFEIIKSTKSILLKAKKKYGNKYLIPALVDIDLKLI